MLKKHSILFSFLFLAIYFSINLHGSSTNIYGIVGQELAKSFSVKEDDASAVVSNGDYEQHKIVCSLFSKCSLPCNGVVGNGFVKKMEILSGGQTPWHSLLREVDHTKTVFGRIALAGILSNPTDDLDELFQRKEIVSYLADDIDGTNHNSQRSISFQLQSVFDQLSMSQADVLSYWKEKNDIDEEVKKRLFYQSFLNSLNSSPVALEIATRLRNVGTFFGTTWPILMTVIQNVIAEKVSGKTDSKIEMVTNAVKRIPHQYSPFPVNYTKEKMVSLFEKNPYYGDLNLYSENELKSISMQNGLQPESYGDNWAIFGVFADNQKEFSPRLLKSAAAALAVGYAGLVFYGIKKTVDFARLNTKTTNEIHRKLIAVAEYVRAAYTVLNLFSKDEILADMPQLEVLEKFLNGHEGQSEKLKQLMKLLQTSTFNGSPSFFTRTGRVLAAHTLMNDVKDELAPFFEALGQIEAYYSAAMLANQNGFTFAQYIEKSDHPVINIKNGWNPFLSFGHAVANDALFNVDGFSRNIVVTGPNTAGKSTITKANAYTLLLGQTLTVVPAELAEFTPFSMIDCHLNITDDLVAGDSLFKAEVKKAKELLDGVRSLRPDQFSFILMDEVFKGTNAEGGETAAHGFGLELGRFENLILVIATHFPKLTTLPEKGEFRNMFVPASLNDDGTLHRPFKIQDGVFKDPENKILNALLRQEGIFATA